MKSVIAILAVCIAASVSAQTSVQVTGKGPSEKEAINDGFRQAIEEVSGNVVLSSVEAKRGKLTKDSIGNYSAGYVDKYEIINVTKNKSTVIVLMDVWVKSSKMADQKLNTGTDSKDIDGPRLGAQLQTYLDERKSADNFIDNIVSDYPSRALKIQQGKPQFLLDGNRNITINVPYRIKWNPDYITALSEALNNVQDGPEYFDLSCLCYKSREKIVVISKSRNAFHLSDHILAKKIHNKFDDFVRIKATVYDTDNNALASHCYATDTLFAGLKPNGTYEIYGYKTETDSVDIPIPQNSKLGRNVEKADRIELAVVSDNQCKK